MATTPKFSSLDTSKLTPFTVDEGYDNELGQHTYHVEYKDAQGNVVKKSTSVENTSGENYDPSADVYRTTYTAPITIGGQTFTGTYGEDGNFQYGQGKEFYQKGHHWLPVIDAQGKVTYQNNDPSDGFGDFVKMVAPIALGAIFPGAGLAIGESLLGAGAAGAATLGGAIMGGGTAALTGGDVGRGLIMGGLMPNLSTPVGTSGFTIGDALKATNVVKAAESGDLMGALTTAAGMAGGADIKIGDYTLGELAKNASLAKSVISGKPQALLGALTNFAKTAQANTPLTPDVIKTLTDAGLSNNEVANADWASLYAQETTDPTTGQTISGNDTSQIANQNLNIGQKQLDSYNQNLQKIIDSGGFTSQWQTSSGDRIMIADDGSGIGINQDGDQYALTPEQVTQMVKNGQLNTADSGYVKATGGTGNTPGGSGTKTTTTPTTKTTPTTTMPTATTPAALAAASWYGRNPADVLNADKNDVAHINPLEELFGGSIYDHKPATSAKEETASESDPVKALEDTEEKPNYSSGGDIHALLQLLRS